MLNNVLANNRPNPLIPQANLDYHKTEILNIAVMNIIEQLHALIAEEAQTVLTEQAAFSTDPPADDDPFALDSASNNLMLLTGAVLQQMNCIHHMQQDKYVSFALAKASANA